MKHCLLLPAMLAFLVACDGQKNRMAASLAEEPLQLEQFDFNTKLATLLPEETRSKEYSGYYKVKSEMLEVDTVSDGEFIGSEKPVRIEYRQRSFSSRDILANFGSSKFNALNFATSLDGEIMLINAVAGQTDKEQSRDLIETLDKKYGKATPSQGEFINRKFDMYTWQLKDRIIRYSLVLDNEENTLKIEVDNEQKTIKNGEKEPHYQGYLFIIRKGYEDNIFGKASSGDFVYLE